MEELLGLGRLGRLPSLVWNFMDLREMISVRVMADTASAPMPAGLALAVGVEGGVEDGESGRSISLL